MIRIFSPRFKASSLKTAAVILSLAVIVGLGLAGTIAWLTASSQASNTFQPTSVACSVNESSCLSTSGGLTEKKNVSVTNTGTMSAYIRVALVASWKDADGHIASPVASGDYTLSLNTTDWFKEGDYYYCKTPVGAGNDSPALINSCTVSQANGSLRFELQVIASAIQYLPDSAVEEAWTDVTVSGGQLQAK